MQFAIVFTSVLSLLTIAVSAAPIPDTNEALHLLSREMAAPLVGMSEVAREPSAKPETETENEEARACRMYSCI
ncbi:hypothetical protein K438DRAFT_1827484 [Mycena galopus ATCC 62051]|nr:hypothetical protein K438DRAFT_2021520 [Mycena galopus ATCC 62051]KAF8194849.1 hypothetical protein K438DRAFT_1827484 [Mycena galopus ATCC 62051]